MSFSSRPSGLRILVFGGDARSDAILSACGSSDPRSELYAYGPCINPGLISKCRGTFKGPLNGLKSMINYAERVEPKLVIVGSEQPLASGLVDELELLGIPTFGPSRRLAQLETSKSWARSLLSKYGIPGNPEYRVFRDTKGLEDYLRYLGEFVIKPDGLTGGKGVRVSGEHIFSIKEAVSYAESLLLSYSCFLIEERLEGEEFSLQSLCDGQGLLHCPVAQDHKRAFDGDVGPNTGGMGSYSCPDHSLPFLTRGDIEQAKLISTLVASALLEETGEFYKGVLYGGFMATKEGIRLLEYNVRFADPEVMNILPILDGDFVSLCQAVVGGGLGGVKVGFHNLATVCKYVVPQGYPTKPVVGEAITLAPGPAVQGLRIYFSSVDTNPDGQIILEGSRAMAFVGIGKTLKQAEELAEVGTVSVLGPVFHRQDIGTPNLIESRVRHMALLRG